MTCWPTSWKGSAIQRFSQVLPVAQKIGDPELLAMSSAAIGVALSLKGQIGKAEPLLRQGMMALAQRRLAPGGLRLLKPAWPDHRRLPSRLATS